jgi:serine protease Do
MEAPSGPLQFVELTDSDGVRIGDRVVAIGHPEQGGLWTLTTGVISTEFEDFNNVKGKSVFQTETGLNRGNSGGPLLDSEGHVVGVNTAIARLAADGMPITSISFSLKANVARTWLREQGVVLAAATGPSAAPKPKSVIPATDRPVSSTSPETPPAPSKSIAAAPSSQAVTPTREKPTQPVKPAPPNPPAMAQTATPSRPYNLDRVVDELAHAEAEMEEMIKDSRREIELRSRRMGGR